MYNSAGQVVRTLLSGRAKPGQYTVVWDGKDTKGKRAGAGVYFYQLATRGRCLSQKVVLTE
ncbi:MAG: FlgD immunoglobulin-like domain containing protein [candidate division WOR-3 bacterium]